MWIGELFDPELCRLMKADLSHREFRLSSHIEKMLNLAEKESAAPASYFVVDKLCDAMNLPVPSVKEVAQAVREDSFEACLTIFHTRGIKSNMPASKMKEVVSMLARRAKKGQN